jgi:hypothetical protein
MTAVVLAGTLLTIFMRTIEFAYFASADDISSAR